MEQFTLPLLVERRIYTVSELNQAIQSLFFQNFSDIWVAGEISNVREANSGHVYFRLKEAASVINCVCFRSTLRYLPFQPQEGIAVLARGRLDVYEARGEYQLIVEFLEPQGLGTLQLLFEQLKRRLAAEGLFDAARKRPLPRFPKNIGIVTSPTGAVIRDMLNILCRRFPGLHIRIYPALVQGPGSVEEVCAGIRYFSESNWADVVIVARGGGSLEDLWTFNEEAVARAIASCKVPVISAIGHETDFTIADFAADLRAPTPSAAAELVVCVRDELLERISLLQDKLVRAIRYQLTSKSTGYHRVGFDKVVASFQLSINRKSQRVDDLENSLLHAIRDLLRAKKDSWLLVNDRLRHHDVRLRLLNWKSRLQYSQSRLESVIQQILQRPRYRLATAEAKLQQLSPMRALERGYALVEGADGQLLKSATQVSAGDPIRVRLAQGQLDATVTEVHPNGNLEPLS